MRSIRCLQRRHRDRTGRGERHHRGEGRRGALIVRGRYAVEAHALQREQIRSRDGTEVPGNPVVGAKLLIVGGEPDETVNVPVDSRSRAECRRRSVRSSLRQARRDDPRITLNSEISVALADEA